ncbi:MAG: nucleotidyl transferase AbiEii/AbiGii toxin family protein [Chlamydiae bacterium]|nr:nucleotidyl transferase AbiEii/AbiGii toxin family protein [Chlamydiota bacterium]
MSLGVTTHKNILIKILKDIFTDPGLGPILGFKGGTAAYLFYGLNRFSIDLDFDLLKGGSEDLVFGEIQKILGKYGVIKEATKKRFNLFYVLSYDNKVLGAQNIKVEINRREFGSRYEVKAYLGISMKVMTREDMAAHKLVAMVERMGKTNRDIYDTWHFLEKNWPINKAIVETRAGMSFKNFLQKCIDLLEKLGERHILSGMGELLDEKQKVWAKANLRKDTIFLLKVMWEGQ